MKLKGKPNRKQAEFFASTARFTAYGGARGGGKSWALRRKLIALCLRWPGIRCLIIRRTLSELRQNHVLPLQREIGREVPYSAGERVFRFRNGSTIWLGYLACDADTLQVSGAGIPTSSPSTKRPRSPNTNSRLSKAVSGIGDYPRRMYLTCNPGGVGHSLGQAALHRPRLPRRRCPDDYRFIQALVTDNDVIMKNDPGYVEMLKAARHAEARGSTENGTSSKVSSSPSSGGNPHLAAERNPGRKTLRRLRLRIRRFALLLLAEVDGQLVVYREYCDGLTLTAAAEKLVSVISDDIRRGCAFDYAVCSPDLWNRRQDSGLSGFEIMSKFSGRLRRSVRTTGESPAGGLSENYSRIIMTEDPASSYTTTAVNS